MSSEKIISQLKKSVVFLGFLVDKKIQFVGTGFRLGIENINFIATAKHVVIDENGERLDKKMDFFSIPQMEHLALDLLANHKKKDSIGGFILILR